MSKDKRNNSPGLRTNRDMKKLGSNHSLNKVLAKHEQYKSPDLVQMKAVKPGWTGRLGDAKRALSRKTKGFSSTSTSSSTPCLFSAAPPPPKRSPSTTLTLRSKSMTAELEELGKHRAGVQTPDSSPCSLVSGLCLCHLNSRSFRKELFLSLSNLC